MEVKCQYNYAQVNKCIYGCSSYGQKGSCPPSVPSVAECREFFSEYEHIAVIHFQKKVNSLKIGKIGAGRPMLGC
jgi:predicted metal-binding protein